MKNKKLIIILIISIVLIGIFSIVSRNGIIIREKKIIKEMDESTQVTELNSQITKLNKEHEDYLNYIQTCKTKIATALTNEGVSTSSDALLETMATNIPNILQARTSDATASAEDIAQGETAYVNGTKITGTMNAWSGLELVQNTIWTDDKVASKTYNLSLSAGTYYIFGLHTYTYDSTDPSLMKMSRKDNSTWTYSNCEVISNQEGCPTIIYLANDATVTMTVAGHKDNSSFESHIYFSVLKLI